MQALSPQGQQLIVDLANRYGVSTDAVLNLLYAVQAGHGTMAQFNHPDLGGSGQWMQGGMTMVGDLFNNTLKAKVDGLCAELVAALTRQPLWSPPASSQTQSQGGMQQGGGVSLFVSASGSGNWWPAELGTPASVGAQNQVRYAYFPATRRLAVESNGRLTVYDALDHQIGGVSQQQGDATTVTFTSQYGVVRLVDLPVASGGAPTAAPTTVTAAPAAGAGEDIIAKIDRLAELRQRNVISEQEFTAKKAELLSRL